MFFILLFLLLVLITIGLSWLCWRIVFPVPKAAISDVHTLPEGRQYKAMAGKIHPLIDRVCALSYEDVFVQYEDDLQLHGKFYLKDPAAPVEILVHGYRSIAERDFCGGLLLALEAGHNALLIDQRAHGASQGQALTFGILESRDITAWVNYVVQRFGKDVKIVLVGMSMGAATVLMAAGHSLPHNVVGVIADSGYTSPKDILCKVMKDRHIPARIVYPLVRFGARLFGKFDPEADSCPAAMQRCRIPVLFIHGESDRFVPCEMTRTNYWHCASRKQLLTVPGAGHGLSYMIDPDGYKKAVKGFLASVL